MNRHKRQEKKEKRKEKKESDAPKDVIDHSMQTANRMWSDIKDRVRDNPDFANYSDSKKIEIYSEGEFAEFYTAFPIVSRYMICMGQFTNKAFKRFLLKCQNMQGRMRYMKGKEKEEEWTKRQADYVRYLWESYQKQVFSANEAQQVWQHAYQTLKKEFNDFNKMKEETEKRLAEEGKVNQAEVAKEMLTRMATGEQSLDPETTKELIAKLKLALVKQNHIKVMKQIDNEIERIRPTRF